MINTKHGYTALAAAVALACGVVNAQEGIDREAGIDSQPGVESTDQHAGENARHEIEGQERSAESGADLGEPAGEEPEPAVDVGDRDVDVGDAESAGSAVGESADESELVSSEGGGDPGQLDRLTEEHADLGKFVEAVKAAGLAESLTGSTSYTVFAPTDDAFDSMPEDWLEPENREQLVSMLRAHIVADDVDQDRAKTLETAQTIDGGAVDISAEEDELMVGDAKVVEPDIQVGNLRVHAIDKVLSESADVASADRGLDEQDADREQGADLEENEEEIATGETGETGEADSTLR